ncbi:MAG: class I SAM-dependent methyltransferase [Nitrosomonadales bacterium]|nr:class I SAM-dependent methyltransferase [Nitrosomonadales bacterium]
MINLNQCPVCDSKEIRPIFTWSERPSEHSWSVSKCEQCTLAFTNPQPTWDELKPYYQRDYKPYQPASAAEFDRLLEDARRTGQYDGIQLDPGARVLEIGPGSGRFLSLAQRMCKEAIGVEPSEAAANMLRDQGCNVFQGHLDEFAESYSGEPFSLVFLSHVLEHIPQPLLALKSIRKIISSKSVVIIRVPNAGSWAFRFVKGDWMGTDLPRHLIHWDMRAFDILARRTDMQVVKTVFDSPPGIVEQAITAHAQYHFRIPRKLVWLVPKLNWSIAEKLSKKWITPETSMNIEIHLKPVSSTTI